MTLEEQSVLLNYVLWRLAVMTSRTEQGRGQYELAEGEAYEMLDEVEESLWQLEGLWD